MISYHDISYHDIISCYIISQHDISCLNITYHVFRCYKMSRKSTKFQKMSKHVENVKKNINKDKTILVMCAAGGRSLIAANLLEAEGYSALNVSDGFSGNGQDPGWKNLGLPSIIDS